MAVLVAREAPDFTTAAVLGDGKIVEDFNFFDYIKDEYAILFFYPLDFTFVCPSELIALNKQMEAFKQGGVKAVGVSIDSQFTHNAWRNTPVNEGGIGKVGYPLVADINHSVCRSYGVEHPQAGVALRAAFLIDRDRIVRHQVVNDLALGRSMTELLRVVDALQFHEEHGEVCPANWQKGKVGMKATPEGVADYLKSESDQL